MSKHTHSYMAYVWEILSLKSSRERRAAPRYAVKVEVQAVLAWSIDELRHEERPAQVLDLSQFGARLRLEVGGEVPTDTPAWLRLIHPTTSDWLPVRIVEVKRPRRRGPERVVRLAFRDSCPYDIFTQIIQGFGTPGGYMTAPSGQPPR